MSHSKCSISFHSAFLVIWLTKPYQSRGIIVLNRIMSSGSCAAGAGRCLAMFGLLVLVQMPGALMSNTESDYMALNMIYFFSDAESASGDTDLEGSGLDPSRYPKCSSCKFGAECDEDSEGIWCVCNIDCSGYNKNPVCGSDGQSYSNPCQIREASCLKQAQINVKHLGLCPDSVVLVGGVSVGGAMPCAEINSSFCVHGTCEMKNDLLTCRCDVGFSGVHCDQRDFSELYVVPNGQKLQYVLIAVIIAAVQISIIIAIIICITRIHPKKPRAHLQKQNLGHFPKDGGRRIV
ncbi:Tomoregulin-1 [Anabarilius grahami]|uniref:Tomoregulin-1 n=1 Tax=Anabarilius grahami TaxID=495550 RepID=A0A3N0XTC8_ANAGA|nr:Tomoregulin-1 [Anabarilius grahami]